MNLEQLIDQFELLTDTEEGLEQLRNVILSQAIRGYLTEQFTNDELAIKLIERIKDKRILLYEEGKIRKPKELSSISKDEIPFDIPENWCWERLGRILEIGSSKRVHKKDWKEQGVPFLRAREIVKLSENGYVDNDLFISNELFQSLIKNGNIPEAKDIMVTGVGTIGVPYVVKSDDKFYFKDASVLIFKNFANFYPWYLFYLFKSPHWIDTIHQESMGTTVHTFTITRANDVLIPFPPLEEQQRIVQKIETLFSQVDELEKKVRQDREVDERLQVAVLDDLQLAETPEASRQSWQRLTNHFDQIYRKPKHIDQLKQAILNEAVRGRLVPQDPNDEPAEKLLERIKEEKQRLYEEDEIRKPKDLPEIKGAEIPFEIPENWKWVRFESIGLTQTGTTPKTSVSKYYGDYIPFLGPGDLSNGEIDYTNRALSKLGLREGRLIPEGSIIMVCIGGSIGKCNVIDRDVSCNQQINTINPLCNVSSELVNQFVRSDFFQTSILNKASGSATPIINRTKWGNLLFPLPPIEEQGRILDKLIELFTWCDDLKAKLSRSQQTDQRLLEALVN